MTQCIPVRFRSSREPSKGSALTNRMAAGLWEQFDPIDVGGNQVAFKARSNGKFVSADLGAGGTLVANRTAVGAWEKFTVSCGH